MSMHQLMRKVAMLKQALPGDPPANPNAPSGQLAGVPPQQPLMPTSTQQPPMTPSMPQQPQIPPQQRAREMANNSPAFQARLDASRTRGDATPTGYQAGQPAPNGTDYAAANQRVAPQPTPSPAPTEDAGLAATGYRKVAPDPTAGVPAAKTTEPFRQRVQHHARAKATSPIGAGAATGNPGGPDTLQPDGQAIQADVTKQLNEWFPAGSAALGGLSGGELGAKGLPTGTNSMVNQLAAKSRADAAAFAAAPPAVEFPDAPVTAPRPAAPLGAVARAPAPTVVPTSAPAAQQGAVASPVVPATGGSVPLPGAATPTTAPASSAVAQSVTEGKRPSAAPVAGEGERAPAASLAERVQRMNQQTLADHAEQHRPVTEQERLAPRTSSAATAAPAAQPELDMSNPYIAPLQRMSETNWQQYQRENGMQDPNEPNNFQRNADIQREGVSEWGGGRRLPTDQQWAAMQAARREQAAERAARLNRAAGLNGSR